MKSFKSFFNPSYGYLRALVGIVAGLVLLIWPDTMKDVIVRIIGGLFLVIGCVSLVIYFISSRKAAKSQGTTDKVKDNFSAVNAVLSIIFGTVLIVARGVEVQLPLPGPLAFNMQVQALPTPAGSDTHVIPPWPDKSTAGFIKSVQERCPDEIAVQVIIVD